MRMSRGRVSTGRRQRKGLSFVEFVGCLIALGGGVALGSVYLGVDMKSLVTGILEQAEIVDPGFFGLDSDVEQGMEVTTEAETEDQPSDQTTDNSASSNASAASHPDRTAAEPDTDESLEIDGEQTAEGPIQTAAEPQEPELSHEEKQAATRLYWQGLTESIRAEVSQRTVVSGDPDNWQLFDYLTHRLEGHQKAVAAIEALEERGVEPRLLWHGKQVLTWNQAGVQLYRRAVDLLTDSSSEDLMGPIAQSWQSSATQLRMEEKLVRDKHSSVAKYLDHAYEDVAPFEPAY